MDKREDDLSMGPDLLVQLLDCAPRADDVERAMAKAER